MSRSVSENWIKSSNQPTRMAKAKNALAKIKNELKGKKFRLIKVSDHPVTFIEIEV